MPARHRPHFFVESSRILGEEVVLDPEDTRHLVTVRRGRAGDLISVSDGAGRLIEARVTSTTGGEVRAEILSDAFEEASRPAITVVWGLAKGGKVEHGVRALVELGVSEVAVFGSGRSVPRWDTARKASAHSRWAAVAREAAKQSRQTRLPRVLGPLGLDEAGALVAARHPGFVADPEAGQGLRAALPEDVPERLGVVVGPEGGLSAGELEHFVRSGAYPVSFGSRILRTENAPVAVVAAVMFHFGVLG